MVDSTKWDYNGLVQETNKDSTSQSGMSPKCDIHIHAIGGIEDGCYIADSLSRKIWFRIMNNRLHLKDPSEYVLRLAQYLKESPIDLGVVLAIDAIYNESGQRETKTSFYVPNSFVFKAAKQYNYLLPGVSIHPNRVDALEEIDRCVEAGAVLIKWLPNAQGIDPSNKKYATFYRKLADYKMPLLSHTGFEFTLPVLDQDLGNPERLRLPLEEGVTVIAAHCGISYSGFSTKYMKMWLALIRDYPNLYGDIAASSIGIVSHYLKQMLSRENICERLVNGSDFPVPSLRTASDLFNKGNPFTRDFNIKTKLGVPDDVFKRGYTLLRKN